MATIQLNNDDLRVMIHEAVKRLCESEQYTSEATLCYIPYFLPARFSYHAIDREFEREIKEEDVIENLKMVVKQIIYDYRKGKLKPDDVFKVIDRNSCIVVVCGAKPSYKKKVIYFIKIITCYVWDGRINIDDGNCYYINEPSKLYLEAQQWNQENQDKVISYTEWMRGGTPKAIRNQKREAEKWYDQMHNEFVNDNTPDWQRRRQYKKAVADQRAAEMSDIYMKMSPEDFKAIGDYDMKMDYMPLSQKGSMNRDLRAMDLRKMRREADRQRQFYGDKVKDVPDEELVKYPKVVGKITLPPKNDRKGGK